MSVSIIVAMSRNFCIGKDNDLPWRQKSDMKFFKETTTGHAIIMGRKTFESMNSKPLPNRFNIVISNTLTTDFIEGVAVVRSLDEGINLCKEFNYEAFVIGGGTIFDVAIDIADTIYLTVINTEIEDGHTFFPEFDYRAWNQKTLATGEADEKNDFDYTIFKMTRK